MHQLQCPENSNKLLDRQRETGWGQLPMFHWPVGGLIRFHCGCIHSTTICGPAALAQPSATWEDEPHRT